MTDENKTTSNEDLSALFTEFINTGEFGRNEMQKKYPHINFYKMLEDHNASRMKMQEAQTDGPNSGWFKVLMVTAWTIFGFTVLAGIMTFGASMLVGWGGIFMGIFALVFTVGFGLAAVAVTMVFINMARNILSTAKDTAEIKEILKTNKHNNGGL